MAARRARPVKLVIGVLATDEDLLGRARHLLQKQFGPVDLQSPPCPSADALDPEMAGAQRQFLSFDSLIDPGRLPEMRRLTDAIEKRVAEDCAAMEGMGPLRLAAGYLTSNKLVVSAANDDYHRVYLSDSVFAEVTLQFRDGAWQASGSASDDYRTEWFAAVRARYLAQLAGD